MDTATHFAMGLGIAGLAYIDPVIASDTNAAAAVLVGAILGSQAPDSDGLLRFRNNATYIKNHRGISHSLPALIIWTGLITFILSLFFHNLPLAHVAFWIFVAVGLHIFSDLFNSYGTQAARPFSEKWIAWNIIHIFDPVIFISHLVGIFLWVFHLAEPAIIFPVLYIFLTFYYIWHTIHHHYLERNLFKQDPQYKSGDNYILIPTIHPFMWNVVKKKENQKYCIGELKYNKLQWLDEVESAEHPVIEISKQHPDIAALLYLSSHARAEIKFHSWGYEVRWSDVRYQHRKQYPFVGILLLDHNYQTLGSYVGWLSDTRLEKKIVSALSS